MTPTRMKLLRMAAGLSQLEICRRTGLSMGTVNAAERGAASAETLLKIAPLLGEATPERLLERTWDLAGARASLRDAIVASRQVEAEAAAAQKSSTEERAEQQDLLKAAAMSRLSEPR
jgi:transcriptional regulator with XRE-family HTH domain